MRTLTTLLVGVSLLASSVGVWAAELTCSVCGMEIGARSRNHIVMKHSSGDLAALHVCSRTCALKARKHDPGLRLSEVIDFNHPEKVISGELAYFLTGSEKVKDQMGEMAMPPYMPAFSTKTDAEAAQKGYGEGTVVKGFENALK